jgi:hypothetical protein
LDKIPKISDRNSNFTYDFTEIYANIHKNTKGKNDQKIIVVKNFGLSFSITLLFNAVKNHRIGIKQVITVKTIFLFFTKKF